MPRLFRLKRPIGLAYTMDEDDVLKTKQALHSLGLYDPPKRYGLTRYPDMPLIDGLKAFQRRSGLREDGVAKPGGPTIRRLNRALTERRRDLPAAGLSSDARRAKPKRPGDQHPGHARPKPPGKPKPPGDQHPDPKEPDRPDKPKENPCKGWEKLIDEIKGEIEEVDEQIEAAERELARDKIALSRMKRERDGRPTGLPPITAMPPVGGRRRRPGVAFGPILDILNANVAGRASEEDRWRRAAEQGDIEAVQRKIEELEENLKDLVALRKRKDGALLQAKDHLENCRRDKGNRG